MYILASEILFLTFILLLLWITMNRILSTIIKFVLQKRYYYYYYYYLLTYLLTYLHAYSMVKKSL